MPKKVTADKYLLTPTVIRSERIAQGLSVADLADLCGVTVSHICLLEKGTRVIHQDGPCSKIMRHLFFNVDIIEQRKRKTKPKLGRPRKDKT